MISRIIVMVTLEALRETEVTPITSRTTLVTLSITKLALVLIGYY